MTPKSEEVVLKVPHVADSHYRLTPVTAEELRNDPEFIRLPPPRGRCKYCNLSRTTMVELLPHVKHVRLRKEGSTRAIILIHRIPAGVPVRTHVHAETGRTDQPEKRRSGAVLKIHIGAGEKKNRQATNAGGGFLNFRMFLIPEQEPSKKLLNSREYTYLNYYRDCT